MASQPWLPLRPDKPLAAAPIVEASGLRVSLIRAQFEQPLALRYARQLEEKGIPEWAPEGLGGETK